MNEHCGESHSADELFSPTTIVSIASQFVTSALDEAGYKNASRVLRQWPKILGKKTAELLMNIFQKREEGKAITEEENSEFVEALREEPRDAAALLGLLAGNILAGTLDVKAERKLVLESYNVVFNLICSFLQKGTSVALKGFVHSEDCISYWHVAGRRPTFELADGEHLLPSTSLDVYLFFEDPTDTRVDELNRQIHKSRDRHLPPGEFDFGRNANVAKLVWVEETSLEIERLDPDGPAFKRIRFLIAFLVLRVSARDPNVTSWKSPSERNPFWRFETVWIAQSESCLNIPQN